MNQKTLVIFSYFFFLAGGSGLAHNGIDHSVVQIASYTNTNEEELSKKNEQINTLYVKDIKPIFQKSCFDCHSSHTKFPWYYKISFVKKVIDKDIEEAKKHLDFTGDYPFQSHETPLNDLKSIKDSILKRRMPPKGYRIMHHGTNLEPKEVKEVLRWIETSEGILK